MNILIEHGGHTFQNVGDWAMLQVAMDRCRKMLPGCRLTVVAASPEQDLMMMGADRMVPAAGGFMALGSGTLAGRWWSRLATVDQRLVQRFPRAFLPLVRMAGRAAGAEVAMQDAYVGALKEADLVLCSGGGYLTDLFPGEVAGVCNLLRTAQSMGKPTALLGQGLGPLDDKPLARRVGQVLRHARILALREGTTSPVVARALGVPADRIAVTGDDAVQLAYDLRCLAPGHHLGVNVRLAAYSGVNAEEVDALRAAIRQVHHTLRAPLTAIPISFHPDENDLRSTMELLPELHMPDLPQRPAPRDVIRLAGRCRLVITGSYHAGVFALVQGIPVIGLAKSDYYAHKFDGLGEQFGPGCQSLRLTPRFSGERLCSMAMDLWNRAEALRPELLKRAEAQIAASRLAYARALRAL